LWWERVQEIRDKPGAELIEVCVKEERPGKMSAGKYPLN
jgi:hypothetical protein